MLFRSLIGNLFDQPEVVKPVRRRFKELLREVTQLCLGWDDPLPSEIAYEFRNMVQTMDLSCEVKANPGDIYLRSNIPQEFPKPNELQVNVRELVRQSESSKVNQANLCSVNQVMPRETSEVPGCERVSEHPQMDLRDDNGVMRNRTGNDDNYQVWEPTSARAAKSMVRHGNVKDMRLRSEYRRQLSPKYENIKRKDIKVGDPVIVQEDESADKWCMARTESSEIGPNGVARTVNMRYQDGNRSRRANATNRDRGTRNKILMRTVQNLASLELDQNAGAGECEGILPPDGKRRDLLEASLAQPTERVRDANVRRDV